MAELTNGTLHTVTCVNSRGESSTKYVIEVPDARSSDVSGSDTTTLSVIVAGYFKGNMHIEILYIPSHGRIIHLWIHHPSHNYNGTDSPRSQMKEFDYDLDYKSLDFTDAETRKLYRIGRRTRSLTLTIYALIGDL